MLQGPNPRKTRDPDMTTVINTPNGNIGRRVTQRLLDSGFDVRVLSRNPDHVKDLTSRGASLVVGSIDDGQFLKRAFDDASAVFWLTPPAYRPDYAVWVRETANKAARALTKAGVERVVNISSVGAGVGAGTGPIQYLGEVESIFNETIPNVVHLRPASFMENYLHQIPSIVSENKIEASLPGDASMPEIATCDVADVTATYLLSDWSGQTVRELLGPRDLSPKVAAELIGRTIDRPLRYEEISMDTLREGMEHMGLPGFVVSMYVEMYTAMREGRLAPEQERSPRTTTPTGLVEFSRNVIKPAVERH